MQRDFEFSCVSVAIDNRPSSPRIASMICGAIKALGYDVIYYGVIPTPALAFKAMQDGMPSIMITGSHIPYR